MWFTCIYNSEKNEIFGQTLTSRMKFFLFYTSFYTFLFSFWLFMLLVFLQTVDENQPNWVFKDSLLKMNPGLSFRPRIPFDKADSSIIIFNINSSKSYQTWVDDLESFFKPYREKRLTQTKCLKENLRNKDCPFLPNFEQKENPCNVEFYGYAQGEPCFVIKLNRVFFWQPSPYLQLGELPKGVDVMNADLKEGKGLILISCTGENQFDRQAVGNISYWPYQGFPVEKYPYQNQKDYFSPFVIIRLRNIRRNVPISIECTAYDKNINIVKSEKIGYIQFELMIEEEPPNEWA